MARCMVNAGCLDHKIGTITVCFTPQVIDAVEIVAQSTIVETLYKISVCDDARGLFSYSLNNFQSSDRKF